MVEERLSRLETAMSELAESQRRMQDALAALAESQRLMQAALGALAQSLQRTQDTLGSLLGFVLELRYPEKAAAHFSLLLTRVDVVKAITLEDFLEKNLNPEEVQQVLLLDCLLRGRTRHRTEPREVWLAVEISATVYPHDVERAAQRAGLLQRAGYPAIPVAAGEDVTPEAEALAQDDHVVLALDGTISFWQDALQTWTA
jgi:multidrug efflux pump subunit AcrA (membrane-fusion protein)